MADLQMKLMVLGYSEFATCCWARCSRGSVWSSTCSKRDQGLHKISRQALDLLRWCLSYLLKSLRRTLEARSLFTVDLKWYPERTGDLFWRQSGFSRIPCHKDAMTIEGRQTPISWATPETASRRILDFPSKKHAVPFYLVNPDWCGKIRCWPSASFLKLCKKQRNTSNVLWSYCIAKL